MPSCTSCTRGSSRSFCTTSGSRRADEPFTNLLTQGMVIKDGKKMSKSLGNVVSPEEMIEKYGADTARLFILFASPPEKELDWSEEGVEGCFRFLNRVWRLVHEMLPVIDGAPDGYEASTEADKDLAYVLASTLRKVERDVRDKFSFNTAISAIMELVNALYKYKEGADDVNPGLMKEAITGLVLALSPFTPHICEELWQEIGGKGTLYGVAWPGYDEDALTRDSVEIVVQINGKLREKLVVPTGLSQEALIEAAKANDRVAALTEGKDIVKIIGVPDKLVNIVVKG